MAHVPPIVLSWEEPENSCGFDHVWFKKVVTAADKRLRRCDAKTHTAILKSFALREKQYAPQVVVSMTMPSPGRLGTIEVPQSSMGWKETKETYLRLWISIVEEHPDYLPAQLRYCLTFRDYYSRVGYNPYVLRECERFLEAIMAVRNDSEAYLDLLVHAFYDPVNKAYYTPVETRSRPWHPIVEVLNIMNELYIRAGENAKAGALQAAAVDRRLKIKPFQKTPRLQKRTHIDESELIRLRKTHLLK